MKKHAILAAFFLAAMRMSLFTAFSQTVEPYARVAILLEGRPMEELARLGIEVDHGLHLPGVLVVTDLSASELALVQQAGFSSKIWIADLQKDYERRLQEAVPRDDFCSKAPVGPYSDPKNYTYGSMGGYHRLEEMMAVLDDMRAKFPQLISERQPLTPAPTHTWEGRRIWYVRISDNPDIEEAEPRVLYTALHHAREPNSASQMLYFMWFLLESYSRDEQVRYIVDHSELYFIPCLNPDGYAYNQTTNPQGGGMWRKNRRNNGNGSFGVDLNRNYGHFWGADDVGSSPDPSSPTYRGPAPFSEPEIQTLRDFMLARDFVFVQNYHTYGNLLIHPWGHSDMVADPTFERYAALLTRQNAYLVGTAGQTVGYMVNGVSDDWMHAATGTYAFTPEVGRSFWPTPSEVGRLNRQSWWLNMATALCALHYGEAKDVGLRFIDFNTAVEIAFVRYGQQPGTFTVSLEPLSPNVLAVQAPASFSASPPIFGEVRHAFWPQLHPDIKPGDEVAFLLQVNNGYYTHTDTLRKVFRSTTATVFQESAGSSSGWQGDWGLSYSYYCSAFSAFTDSPEGLYARSAEARLVSPPISLPSTARVPRLRFCARWQIEPNFDYLQVRAYNDQIDLPLCGLYTRPGSGKQPLEEPIYEGYQDAWVQESMDLTPFIGQTFRLSFTLVSDISVQLDGFYLDDIVVEYEDINVPIATDPAKPLALRLWNWPNPADEYTQVRWEGSELSHGPGRLVVYNALGAAVYERVVGSAMSTLLLPTAEWPAGTYFYHLQTPNASSALQRFIVLHP